MTQPDGLERRAAALETTVETLNERVDQTARRSLRSEQDAAAARVLAGGADREVADLGSEVRSFREQNTRVMNAMRSDLTDLRSDLIDLRDHVDRNFLEVRGRLDAGAAGQQVIVGLLNTLIERGSDE